MGIEDYSALLPSPPQDCHVKKPRLEHLMMKIMWPSSPITRANGLPAITPVGEAIRDIPADLPAMQRCMGESSRDGSCWPRP